MAEGGNSAEGSSTKCVNLLYLATQAKKKEMLEQSKIVKGIEDVTYESHSDVNRPGSTDSSGSDTTRPPRSSSSNHRLTKPASTTSMHEKEVERICPRVNCPEKIIICLDVSNELEKPTFRSRAGDKFASIKLIKRAIGIFVHSKHKLNPLHQFALVALREQAYWMHDFTSDPDKVISILQNLDACFSTESCDLASLFDSIQEHAVLPQVQNPSVIPPSYIVRTILVYGRSHCLPSLSDKESLKMLMSSPHFFLDAFYVHDVPSPNNQCEAIFDNLCELDEKGLFYIFEVSRNPTRLYDCMAQLLPHPLQRPIQTDASYDIETKPELH